MDFLDLGWRDAILALIALLGVYLLVLLMRLSHLRRKKSQDMERDSRYAAGLDSTAPEAEKVSFSSVAAGLSARLSSALQPSPENRLEPIITIDQQRLLHNLESEVMQMHSELYLIRKELSQLQEDVGHLQASSGSSPLYSEAVALASRGVDAAGIAGRCGISLGEAELVVALSHKPATPLRTARDSEEGLHDRDDK